MEFYHSVTRAEIPFSQWYFYLSIFSLQIENIKSLIYNCQMEEKKKAPFPGTFFQNSKRTLKFAIFISLLFWAISLSNTVQNYHQIFTCISIFATTHKLAKWKIKVYMTMSMWKENGYIGHCVKREQKVQNNVSDKKYLILQSGVCVSNQTSTPYEARDIPLHQRPARRAKVLNRVV